MATFERKAKSLAAIPGAVARLLIKLYQWVLSPLLGPRCRFYPSCSNYAIQAIDQHGLIHGSVLSAKRICKCHPGHPGGIDEVPPAKHKPIDAQPCTHLKVNDSL